ncbi:hypothetical protein K2173_008103 [Erythroxylum novogranatense]|uniref:Charged multivesicular body protein 7 n=1 Tax=Erythroxylum novogranatense TaxID=1862640 RepID=A0AAV8S9D6_9ROSI|nr:hypothetical protein K2173_008103 [Erythroxylum novogranatense]
MEINEVGEFIRKEVPDWDNDDVSTARFKAFSGQRSDWESKYQFWRDLILKIARHLGVFIIRPTEVKNFWFNRGGLNPLCLDHVLFLMYNEGDIVPVGDLVNPSTGLVSQFYRKVRNFVLRSAANPELLLQDHLILMPLEKEKAAEVVEVLCESHWTSSCVITMKRFQDLCGGLNEATAVLSYLAGIGTSRYLSINKKELIEGVKVSLSPATISKISSLDCDVLYLIWITEKLQQQIDVIDQRHDVSRKAALASLNSGNKKMALRHARQLKLASESREKCTSLLNRVEEVVNAIANAESTKMVSEAIQIGAQAMKQNKITIEEVELCLEELEEGIDSQKKIEKTLESTPAYIDIDDTDVEVEFNKLQFELQDENSHLPTSKVIDSIPGGTYAIESSDPLSDAFSNLKLQDDKDMNPADKDSGVSRGTSDSKQVVFEAA